VKRLVVATLPFSAGCIYGCGPHEVQFNVAYPEDDAGVAIMDAGCDALCSVRGFETLESCMKAPNEVECVAVLPSTGRRPAELVRVDSWTSHVVANWSAAAAQMEAASVPAFEILARELAAHDAPSSLIARALESADDERRHARIMTSLARAHGATPGPVRASRSIRRSPPTKRATPSWRRSSTNGSARACPTRRAGASTKRAPPPAPRSSPSARSSCRAPSATPSASPTPRAPSSSLAQLD
jgi:hypothetical protein